jgi:2-polyprenyl-6-hydroxyphenyl methylase/3-demethylubiquinone-9 3-methyltransferase
MINNDFYETLEERWYTASDHPIALLRAENAIRTPWILGEIEKRFSGAVSALDIGCGAGLLTNALALKGHKTFGIDLSENSLKVAKSRDVTGTVEYRKANAYELPFENESFDVVCATDVLEHVEKPSKLLFEASRTLKQGGIFFFHTFNRNPLSYILIIKGVDWFVKGAPKNMHVYPLFIRPSELTWMAKAENLRVDSLIGLRPNILSLPFFKLLWTREVPPDFSFQFCKSLATGYCGIAKKIA